MTDLILCADAGDKIGWGHAMRMMALAQAAEGRARTTLYTTTQEVLTLDWPCAVCLVDDETDMDVSPSTVLVMDGVGPVTRANVGTSYVFNDYGDPEQAVTVINPNFDRIRYDGKRVISGPRFYPLRKGYVRRIAHPDGRKPNHVLLYRCDNIEIDQSFSVLQHWETVWDIASCVAAVVPPSVVAYECMALGVPVLLNVTMPEHEPLAEAMVMEGVAVKYTRSHLEGIMSGGGTSLADRAASMVDGHGATRLLDLILP